MQAMAHSSALLQFLGMSPYGGHMSLFSLQFLRDMSMGTYSGLDSVVIQIVVEVTSEQAVEV